MRVTIAEEDGARSETSLEGEYVVGCDGGRSLVREQLGIDRGGADFDQRMVLAVFRSRELHEGLKRFPERTTYRVLKPELQGYWQFFGRIDVGEGCFFHAPVPRDTTPDNYDFLGLLQEAAGFPFEASFDHVGFWDLRIVVASSYRTGRVFIAGDACHSTRPTAASASTPASRTSPTWAGSSRRRSGLGRRRAAATPTARSGGRSSRRPARR